MRIGLPAMVALIWLVADARAADFRTVCDYKIEVETGCAILMTGTIRAGDAKRLRDELAKPAPPPGFYRLLVLSSPGGDVVEALKLGDVVREALLQTTTHREEKLDWQVCASACFLVWAAGGVRRHYTNGKGAISGPRMGQPWGLGLHRPYFSQDAYETGNTNTLAKQQQQLAARVMDHLRNEGIPSSLIEEMMKRSSREILWLHTGDPSLPEIPWRAPWLEEMLIARCGYDPVKDKAADKASNLKLAKILDDPDWKGLNDPDPEQDRAREERLRVNTCLYHDLMIPAQRRFQDLKVRTPPTGR